MSDGVSSLDSARRAAIRERCEKALRYYDSYGGNGYAQHVIATDVPALLDALAAAEAENARLRTALEHYASADSWTAPTTSTPYVGLWWGNGNRYFRDIYVGAYDDGANVARKALGEAAPATREE